jgi:hypothetical protein
MAHQCGFHDSDDMGLVEKMPFSKMFLSFKKDQEGQAGELDASRAVAAGRKANGGSLGAGRGAGRFGAAPGRFPGGRGGPLTGRGVPIPGGMWTHLKFVGGVSSAGTPCCWLKWIHIIDYTLDIGFFMLCMYFHILWLS